MTENCGLSELLDESINLELSVSEIYFHFSSRFPPDSDFWWKLVAEEKNHAALIRSGKEYFIRDGMFPARLLHGDVMELKDTNSKLRQFILRLSTVPLSRENAFNLALYIENSAGEIHFQRFMEEKASMSSVEKLFCQLNSDDHEHATRIRSYMDTHGIPFSDISTFI